MRHCHHLRVVGLSRARQVTGWFVPNELIRVTPRWSLIDLKSTDGSEPAKRRLGGTGNVTQDYMLGLEIGRHTDHVHL